MRDWLARNVNQVDRVALLLDIENSFNTVDRLAIRLGMRRACPVLVPRMDLCYAEPSELLLGVVRSSAIRGTSGVRGCHPRGHPGCQAGR